jgi:hypothetical protein
LCMNELFLCQAVVSSLWRTTRSKKSFLSSTNHWTSPQDTATRMSAWAIDPYQTFPSNRRAIREICYTGKKTNVWFNISNNLYLRTPILIRVLSTTMRVWIFKNNQNHRLPQSLFMKIIIRKHVGKWTHVVSTVIANVRECDLGRNQGLHVQMCDLCDLDHAY